MQSRDRSEPSGGFRRHFVLDVFVDVLTCLHHARRHGGALGCQAPPVAAGAPQMKFCRWDYMPQI